MSTMIEKALKSATITETGEVDELSAELTKLMLFENTLLPVEERAKKQVNDEIARKKARIERLKAAEILDLPRLDASIFGWTKKQKAWKVMPFGRQPLDVPVFAYIPIDHEVCTLSATRRGYEERYGSNARPSAVTAQYEKIMNQMAHSLSGRITSVEISYRYEGVIPNNVREIIQAEKGGERFKSLGLVCEVDSWKITKTERPPREFLDPILVGEKAGALWVLASFDPTPVEQYLLNEFTTKENA